MRNVSLGQKYTKTEMLVGRQGREGCLGRHVGRVVMDKEWKMAL